MNAVEKLSIKNRLKVQEIYKETCYYFPSLSETSEKAGIEVEGAANLFFQKLYKEEIDAEQAAENLSKYKNSQNPTEKEIFACVISNLFDEYRFHPHYPVKELTITGEFFGIIINSK